MDAKQVAMELLSRKRCQIWPECSCAKIIVRWQERPVEEWPVEIKDLAWVELSIFLALSCAERHCPDRKVRAYAAVQLLNPYWNRQRRGEELTEEFVQRRLEEEQ
jgi:hypothetical protein